MDRGDEKELLAGRLWDKKGEEDEEDEDEEEEEEVEEEDEREDVMG